MESALVHDIRLALGAGDFTRIFRNQVGEAWFGEAECHGDGSVTLHHARRVPFGLCTGSSDLIGWRTIHVTPEYLGSTLALFTAIEAKQPRGRASREQRAFLSTVQRFGGLAGVARSVADARRIVLLD